MQRDIYTRAVVGTLSQWDKFTTRTIDDKIPVSDHEYTIEDLFSLLNTLRRSFDANVIEEIEDLLHKHRHDFNNPHRVDLDKMNTSVVQELYKLWIEKGNQGSREDFLKVLFQYIIIADIETTRAGDAYDQVTSVKGVATVLEDHNTDANAHEAMWAKLFPGSRVDAVPSYAIHGFIGFPCDVSVSRNSPMWVLNAVGQLEQIPANTLAADYSLGNAAFPIFSAHTNLLVESENFFDTSKFSISNATIVRSSSISNLRDQNQMSLELIETVTPGSTIHGITVTQSIQTAANTYYVISAFVRPKGRTCAGLAVSTGVGGAYPFAQFDLENQFVFVNDTVKERIQGHVLKLYNGWYRIWMVVKSVSAAEMSPKLYSLDIYDGDMHHQGQANVGLAVFGISVTQGETIPPYIPSSGSRGILAATTVSTNASSWYRKNEGTVVITATNIHGVTLDRSHELYTLGAGTSAIALTARFPAGHKDRCYFSAYANGNSQIMNAWSEASDRFWVIAVHGYSNVEHVTGTWGTPVTSGASISVNPNVTTLYLGCDRYGGNQLNGYIKSIVYYPSKCTEDNLRFFRCEA